MNDNTTAPISSTKNDKNAAARNGGGPKTAGGKARSRMNALRFGLFTSQALLPGEDVETFREFRTWLMEDLRPATAVQTCLADEIVGLFWKLQRAHRAESESILRLGEAVNGEYQGVAFAILADLQESNVLVAIGNAEERLHGQLRRLIKTFREMQREDAKMLNI
ncbi:MAG: hypothetical protein ACI9VS_000954 [Candidatus Binatia bacterium]|jgi:hypothetical protein